ncbi:hypothetical protein N7539_008817 [Penicillium diatomitis]|uniref:Uncharacterized protein n=1 Tax=Penicillium diatomitis TaxID=2819901 RepID=A0A9W9WQQ4_9EURO|nr:uncharacterized protein N7539_008817 [Penicillium diatomitis]KAJ5471874.1 hypothetical protein N7539_008817 [Penicillium diatomitis]
MRLGECPERIQKAIGAAKERQENQTDGPIRITIDAVGGIGGSPDTNTSPEDGDINEDELDSYWDVITREVGGELNWKEDEDRQYVADLEEDSES